VMWRRPPSWTRPAAGPASSPAAGLAVPLVTVRRQLYITEPIAGVLPLQPIVRLLEATVYVRYADGGVMFGGYEDDPRVIQPESLPPEFQGPTWRSTSAFSVA